MSSTSGSDHLLFEVLDETLGQDTVEDMFVDARFLEGVDRLKHIPCHRDTHACLEPTILAGFGEIAEQDHAVTQIVYCHICNHCNNMDTHIQASNPQSLPALAR